MGVIDIFNNDSECLAYHVHEYKLGYVVECELDGEPYCGDSWILLPAENLWNRWVRGSLYVFALAFLFVGKGDLLPMQRSQTEIQQTNTRGRRVVLATIFGSFLL